MSRTTALCFVVMNEYAGCKNDVPRIDLSGFDQVFAIDGNSTDGTPDLLAGLGVSVHAQRTRSLNAAYWQAVETCRADNLIVYFPKGTIDSSIVYEIKRQLESHDFVVARRLRPGARNEEDDRLFRPRKWGVQALARTASLLWRAEGPYMTDFLHGVKGFSVEAFRRMRISRVGVTIDLEMVVRFYRLKLSRCEVPVIESPRIAGSTRFNILPTAVKLGRFLLGELTAPEPLGR